MHYIWYSAKHTHVYWSPIRNIFSCIQRKLRKLIVVCLGTIHVWRGPLGRRIPIRSLGMSHSLWPHLACARVPENHLILKKSLHISEILYSGRCWTNVLAYFGQIEQTKRNAANKQKCAWNCKSDTWVWQNLNIKWTSYFSKYLKSIRIIFHFLSDFVLFADQSFIGDFASSCQQEKTVSSIFAKHHQIPFLKSKDLVWQFCSFLSLEHKSLILYF